MQTVGRAGSPNACGCCRSVLVAGRCNLDLISSPPGARMMTVSVVIGFVSTIGSNRVREHGGEKVLERGGGETDRVVSRAVVHAYLAARRVVQEAAREDDVRNVAGALVRRERGEDPVGKAS